MISVLITAQKFNKLPTSVRCNLNLLFAFKLMNMDWKKIEEEIIYSDKEVFYDVLDFVFKDDGGSNFLLYNVDSGEFYKKFDKINI